MTINFDFAQRTVLITGAAQGIGKALAQHFAASNARVAVVDRDEPELTGQLHAGAVAELVWQPGRLVLRRQNWQSGEWEERSAPWLGGKITVLCDRSSLECFVDGGRQSLSTRYFPGENPVLSARCDGDGSKICLDHLPLATCLVQ